MSWIARQASRGRTFVVQTAPVYIAEHREELFTGGVSLAAHVLLALILAIWMLPSQTLEQFGILATRIDDTVPDVIELQEIVQPNELRDLEVDSRIQQLISAIDDGRNTDVMTEIQEQDLALDLDPTDADMERLFLRGDFGGRTAEGRKATVKRFGGTAESERAVNLGLKWLTRIQRPDGSWSFGDVGPDAQSGSFASTDMGATAMALLCYLGAGHSHAASGPYQQVVENGLRFMGQQVVMDSYAADLRGQSEGNSGMYVQGLATICLCEAHALDPGHKDLAKLAGQAIDFIERAQDPAGGGWRYVPRQRGDTSVVGWQVMALQSAKAGGLRVSGSVLRDARNFLVSVQESKGARYAYTARREATPTMTAVGLLCRMYMGWRQDNKALKEGVNYLSSVGPSDDDIYYNYYATQVLRHFGGELWTKWNNKMRTQLVRSQIPDGPAAGSWPVTDPHGDAGGQLYQTTLSILTLEVYYRHLPLYRQLDK